MSKNILQIDDQNFEAEVLGSDKPFLLDFGATWCGPCKALVPVIENLAQKSAGRFAIGKIDIDESPEVSKKLGIRGAPTLVVFKGGKETARHVGVTNEATLLALMNR